MTEDPIEIFRISTCRIRGPKSIFKDVLTVYTGKTFHCHNRVSYEYILMSKFKVNEIAVNGKSTCQPFSIQQEKNGRFRVPDV